MVPSTDETRSSLSIIAKSRFLPTLLRSGVTKRLYCYLRNCSEVPFMSLLSSLTKSGSLLRSFSSVCGMLRPVTCLDSTLFSSATNCLFNPFARSFAKTTRRYERTVGNDFLLLSFSRQRWLLSIQRSRTGRSEQRSANSFHQV